jgi:MraZ protein
MDPKGRVIVPAKFKELLGDEFVMTRGSDKCAYVFPRESWDKFEEKLEKLPINTNKNAYAYHMLFMGSYSEVDVDKQGRTLVPQQLREHAGLQKEVVFVGSRDRCEIWDKETYTAKISDIVANFDEIIGNIGDIEPF